MTTALNGRSVIVTGAGRGIGAAMAKAMAAAGGRLTIADIDGAMDHVHLLFYIWLADNNGFRIKNALVRAARRGVKVRP